MLIEEGDRGLPFLQEQRRLEKASPKHITTSSSQLAAAKDILKCSFKGYVLNVFERVFKNPTDILSKKMIECQKAVP